MIKDPEIWQESQKSASPDAAYHLCELMSQISEDCYFAGWLKGNEKVLWDMVHSDGTEDSRRYGIAIVDASDLAQLGSLMDECKGWWIFEEEDPHEKFITLDEAKEYFATWAY